MADPIHGISTALKKRRQELRLSLGQVARRVGTSPATILRYEAGWCRFGLYTLHKLATALGCRLRIDLRPVSRRKQAPTEALERLRRLFWDKPLEPEDLTRHPRWVIQRVLEMGNLQDVQGLIGMVGKESFLGEVCCLRFSSEKTTALWQAMLKLEGVRCTSESSRRAARISWLR